ncbi:hypothetical protein niasHT_029821 [Heterodera trifolii]|uniref:Uncharacterized protein n=1 Tax=Heterodera trifolii TaxID=157864 RepID=A0ABD2K0S5_9BILA
MAQWYAQHFHVRRPAVRLPSEGHKKKPTNLKSKICQLNISDRHHHQKQANKQEEKSFATAAAGKSDASHCPVPSPPGGEGIRPPPPGGKPRAPAPPPASSLGGVQFQCFCRPPRLRRVPCPRAI